MVPPCVEEMPKLQKLWELLHTDNFEILAVDLGEDERKIRGFFDKIGMSVGFPVLLTRDEPIMGEWRIKGLPTSYIIDTRGRWGLSGGGRP